MPEDERGDALRLAQLAGAQLLDRHEHHLLHEVGGRVVVAQVAAAVEAHAWGEQAVELGLGGGVDARAGRGDAPRELGVLGPGLPFAVHLRSFAEDV